MNQELPLVRRVRRWPRLVALANVGQLAQLPPIEVQREHVAAALEKDRTPVGRPLRSLFALERRSQVPALTVVPQDEIAIHRVDGTLAVG